MQLAEKLDWKGAKESLWHERSAVPPAEIGHAMNKELSVTRVCDLTVISCNTFFRYSECKLLW
jgi:hypothetical protein